MNVERVKGLSGKEFIERYMAPGKPVVLEDATRDWPALQKWTPEFWSTQYGTRRVKIDGQEYSIKEVIQLALESTAASPAPYYRRIALQLYFPELVKDVSPTPGYCKPNWLQSLPFRPLRLATPKFSVYHDLFIGGAGRSFPHMHFDDPGSHTFINQIVGRKVFTMFHPRDTDNVYPGTGGDFPNSRVGDVDNVDLNKFPLFAKATPWTVEISTGETLFIPCGWWHTAKMLTYSISIATDLVNHTNWGHFIEYQRRKVQVRKRALGHVYFKYLQAAGLVLRINASKDGR